MIWKQLLYNFMVLLNGPVKNVLFCLMDRFRNVCVSFMARNRRFPKVGTHGCQGGNHRCCAGWGALQTAVAKSGNGAVQGAVKGLSRLRRWSLAKVLCRVLCRLLCGVLRRVLSRVLQCRVLWRAMVTHGSQVGNQEFNLCEPAVPCNGNLRFLCWTVSSNLWEPAVPCGLDSTLHSTLHSTFARLRHRSLDPAQHPPLLDFATAVWTVRPSTQHSTLHSTSPLLDFATAGWGWTRRAAIRTYKCLHAMVRQHDPQLQKVYEV